MPSRRRLLAASVPLVTATAGCLGRGTPDVVLSNELDRAASVRVTIERDSDGSRVLRRTVELTANGPEATERFRNPATEARVAHTVHVLVKNGPEATERFSDTGGGPFSAGNSGLHVDIRPAGIEFRHRIT